MFQKKYFLVYFTLSFLSSFVDILADDGKNKANLSTLEKLPSTIPTCKEDDLNLNECIKAGFQEMVAHSKEGIPELNLAPIDPLVREKMTFEVNGGAFHGRVSFKNLKIYGLGDAIIESVDFKKKDKHVEMKQVWRTPNLYLEGMYKAEMRFNNLKLTPKGFFNCSINDLLTTTYPEGDINDGNDGHSYLKLKSFNADMDIGDMKIYASGLVDDPELNTIILDFMNQNWRDFYKTLIPQTRSVWEPFMLNAANDFLSTLPFDLLLTKN